MSKEEQAPEFELLVLDSLNSETFKSAKQISAETGIAEETVRTVLESLLEDLAIINRGSLFRWVDDADTFEDDSDDD